MFLSFFAYLAMFFLMTFPVNLRLEYTRTNFAFVDHFHIFHIFHIFHGFCRETIIIVPLGNVLLIEWHGHPRVLDVGLLEVVFAQPGLV